MEAWHEELDRMLRLDGREPGEVEVAIRWVFGANLQGEAQFVVLSAPALRKKFDRIAVQMERKRRSGPKTGSIPEGSWSRGGEQCDESR